MAQKVVRPAFLLLLTVGTVLAANPNSNFGNKIYSKIALGSCTAYDETPQTIWRDAILPNKPEAWIWAGDFVYMDDPVYNCGGPNKNLPECICKNNYIQKAPYACNAGNAVNALKKTYIAVTRPDYEAFLQYMCPGFQDTGLYIPIGDDTNICPNPILGVWDDHDYAWNDGNKRLPVKMDIKKIYLDAIGTRHPIRYQAERGLEWAYSFNAPDPVVPAAPPPPAAVAGPPPSTVVGTPPPMLSRKHQMIADVLSKVGIFEDSGSTSATTSATTASTSSSSQASRADGLIPPGDFSKMINVIMLDERYNRDTLPCYLRREYCTPYVQNNDTGFYNYAWCEDFLVSGGVDGKSGSCCKKDEEFLVWCKTATPDMPYWQQVCNYSSPDFGYAALSVVNGTVQPFNPLNPLDLQDFSSFCDVLGKNQRRWLEDQLAANTAPIKLIVSGSVVIGKAPAIQDPYNLSTTTECSGDDFDCYWRAQQALLRTINRYGDNGCTVILTGDYHISDFRAIFPNTTRPYGGSKFYDTNSWLNYPIYQMMSSGMTRVTANPKITCADWRLDPQGLRQFGQCNFVGDYSFGMLEFDWTNRYLKMQLMSGINGSIWYQYTINIDTCTPVNSMNIQNYPPQPGPEGQVPSPPPNTDDTWNGELVP